MSNKSNERLREQLQFRRRTVMGALAAGGSLAALGSTAAQEEGDDDPMAEDDVHPIFGFAAESAAVEPPVEPDHEVEILERPRTDAPGGPPDGDDGPGNGDGDAGQNGDGAGQGGEDAGQGEGEPGEDGPGQMGPPPEWFFEPTGLFIEPGETVRFQLESHFHTVTAYHPRIGYEQRVPENAEAISSPVLWEGAYFLYTFDEPGVYDLLCLPHERAGHVMRIVVGEPTGPGATEVGEPELAEMFPDPENPVPPVGGAGTVLDDPQLDPNTIVNQGRVHWDDLAEESRALPHPMAEDEELFTAVLSGAQAGVDTDASGCATFSLTEGGVAWDLLLEDIECVTAAHIHEGARDEEGPVVGPMVGYTENPDGTGEGDPRSTLSDEPIIETGVIDDPELAEDLRMAPEEYYVNVHTVHNPGGEVRGQIRRSGPEEAGASEPHPAEFTVSNLDPQDATVTQGDLIDVSATITNDGDVTETQTVEFRVDDDVIDQQDVELACRESETVTFADVDTADLEPGEYEHGVFTDDDSETGTLTIEEEVVDAAEFSVSDLDPMDVTVSQGDLIDVSATITNDGEESGTQTVEFRVDDDPLADQELTLEPDESETVTFADVDTADLEPGEYTHGVFTDDDSETGTLTIEEEVAEAAEFLVSGLDPMDVTVSQGELIDVSATITNDGEESGTQTVEFRVDDDPLADQELTLEPDEFETVTFADIDTSPLEPDDYEHGVFTDDDSQTATLTIEEGDETEGDPEDNNDE